VIRAGRSVLFRPPAELRPDERHDAIGDPAGLEVALEGEEALCGHGQPGGQLVGLVVGRVVGAGCLEGDTVERQAGRQPPRERCELAAELVGLVRGGGRLS